MVLEFNGRDAFFNRRRSQRDDLYHVRPVTYTDLRPQVDLMQTNFTEFFLTKSEAWAYESEWRMVVPLSDCETPLAGLQVQIFPKGCLSAVILGANVSTAQQNEVMQLLKTEPGLAGVELRRAKLNERAYNLDFEIVAPGR